MRCDRPCPILFALVLCAATLTLNACGGSGAGGSAATDPLPSSPPLQTGVQLKVERAFPGLTFQSPVAMLQAPDDNTHWYVVEQGGTVRRFANESGASAAEVFADITSRVVSGGERGLLGMAFHPGFALTRHVYLSYTANAGNGLVSRISEFTLASGGKSLDPASERILITVAQPEDNHKGGNLRFGPDGYLYIGFGDGGGANDQHGATGNAQLLTTLLGKMLRVDVDGTAGATPYRIPTDNPYAGNATCERNGSGAGSCPEIFAYGFRNPWRWSFDRNTGTLWVADVGQDAREEVDRVAPGRNYGWRCLEGTRSTGFACGANADPQPPVAEYGHDLGSSITGGFVYRGSVSPKLAGRFVFGDFGSGRVWSIANDAQPTQTLTSGAALESHLGISSFSEANDGEIYLIDYSGGIYHLTAP